MFTIIPRNDRHVYRIILGATCNTTLQTADMRISLRVLQTRRIALSLNTFFFCRGPFVVMTQHCDDVFWDVLPGPFFGWLLLLQNRPAA